MTEEELAPILTRLPAPEREKARRRIAQAELCGYTAIGLADWPQLPKSIELLCRVDGSGRERFLPSESDER